MEFLEWLKARGYRRAIVSSSTKQWIEDHLCRLGIANYFDVVCSRDDAKRVKPDPDLYIRALEMLAITPQEALAIEDSLVGVQSAQRAQIKCVALPNLVTRHVSLSSADVVCKTFHDIRIWLNAVIVGTLMTTKEITFKGATADALELKRHDVEHFWHPSKQMAEYTEDSSLIIDRASDYRIWDVDGNEYVDGNSSVWCVNFGYSQNRIINAVERQLRRLPFASLSAFTHAPAIRLAARLAKLSFDPNAHVLFATSGAEGIECSIKIARQFFAQNGQGSRVKIISLKGSYHGHTLGALGASGITAERFRYEPLPQGFAHVEGVNCFRCHWGKRFPGCNFDCAAAVEEEIMFQSPDTVAAILLEPILASSGMYIPPFEYLRKMEQIARQIGCLFIIDEVLTGIGRTGRMFFYEHCGLKPDIVIISKGITGGYQALSAVICSERVFQGFLGSRESGRALVDFHTFGGHPASCAAALEVLNLIEEGDLLSHVTAMGKKLAQLLSAMQLRHKCIGDVRGLGLMFGIEFIEARTSAPLAVNVVRNISTAAMKRGLVVRPLRQRGNIICVVPPLVIDSQGISILVERLEGAITDVVGGD